MFLRPPPVTGTLPYGKRIEDSRLPRAKATREAYAQTVGEDGFRVLDAVDAPDAPAPVRTHPSIVTLRRTWQRHYERTPPSSPVTRKRPGPHVRFKTSSELSRATEGIELPYDPQARYRHKRETQWTGYMVHLRETCEPMAPHLITHVHTTAATVHEAQCTAPIQQALITKGVPPQEHLVDVEGAYTLEHFEVDWNRQQVRCPQSNLSVAWWEHGGGQGSRPIIVAFDKHACGTCPVRPCCPRAEHTGRRLQVNISTGHDDVQICLRATRARAVA